MAINSVNGNTLLQSGMFPPCRVATTGPITLSGLQTIDTIALNAGDRVLAWQQADATTNGIYAASTSGWVRTTDAASNSQFFEGMLVAIGAGAANAGIIFQCTCSDDPVVVGTSLLTFMAQSLVQTGQQHASSTSSQTVGTGAMSFQVPAGLGFKPAQWVVIFDASASMLAQITSYSGTTLAVTVTATSGSGSHADWTIVLANSQASAGIIPPVGTGNVTGPGSSSTGHLATFADTTGKVLADGGIAPGTLAGRTTLLYGDAGAASIGDAALVSGAAPLAFVGVQPHDNLYLVNDSVNPTRDINITAGRCRDDSDVINLQLSGTMVKRLDQAWAAGGITGTPAGACDSGTKGASQTWHIFLIAKRSLAISSVSRSSNIATVTSAGHGLGVGGSTRSYGIGGGFDGLAVITAVTTNTYSYANTGANVGATAVAAFADAFDILASQSYLAPTLPSGWTVKQSIGSFMTDGSGNVIAIIQIGDRFFLNTPILSVTGLVYSAAANITLAVPVGLPVLASFQAIAEGSNDGGARFYSPSQPDVSVTTNNGTQSFAMDLSSGPTVCRLTATLMDIPTDALAQVRIASNAAYTFNIIVVSYRDPRRRLF